MNPLLISEDNRWAVCSGKALNVPLIAYIQFLESLSALLLESTVRVCKSSARSTIFIYVNPRSFAPFFTYPSFSTSSLALWAFVASSNLPWPWHRPSTTHYEEKCGDTEHTQSCKITHKNKYKINNLVFHQLTSIPAKQVWFHFLLLVKLYKWLNNLGKWPWSSV